MVVRTFLLALLLLPALVPGVLAADKPKRSAEAVKLVGQATDFFYTRNWNSYYWREDFSFLLKDEKSGKTWRVISREPTPAYNWRMGTTFTGLKVDWKAKPRVKVIGVIGVDRLPAEFYTFKLNDPNLATAFVVYVDKGHDQWKEYYVNNWFHRWGPKTDKVIYKLYAGRQAPYDIYGYINGQVAPFSKKAQALITQHKSARMFHGLIRATKDNTFGYEIELLHLFGPDKQGNGVAFYGDGKKVPLLDMNKPAAPKKKTRPRFVDVTAASGIKIAKNTGVGGTNPHAVAVEDFNGDGKPDIIILTFGAPHVRYFRNLGNLRFADVTRGSGLETFQGEGTGIAVGDFDRDGKLDVYVTSLRKGASRLYKGNGDGTFTDVSAKAGVLLKTPARSCAWSDVDGDGWLDLYVTSPNGTNYLFRNNGDGTFTDITKKAGVGLAGRHSLGCAFGDVDGDGLDDLFVTCYDSQVSALFKNLGGGKFRDVTAQAGLNRKASSVGCVFGDVFNRGVLDLYVTTDSWLAGANYTEPQLLQMKKTVEPNVLYRNDSKGKFSAVQAATLNLKTLSHDAVLEDLDHDGLVDIFVAVDAESGNQWATSKGGNPLWTRPDGKTWREVGKEWGVKQVANCVCVAAADFDNDGDLDLLLVNFYSNVVLLRNDTNDRNWLRVKVVGVKSNLDGIGAKVSVFTTEGGKKKLVGFRQIQSGSGYCRCSPLEAHFGLGQKPAASYRVEVFFPATKTRVVRAQVKPGQRIVVKEK